jgi:cell division protein FtsI/penicillin-binding protein 2
MPRHTSPLRIGIGLFGLMFRALPFVAVILAIWAVRGEIAQYGASLVKNREWVTRVEVPVLSALHGTVFARLVSKGLIWAERDPGLVLIRHSPCTNVTRAAPDFAFVRGTPSGKEREQLIDLLCRSPQGQFIRNEIDAWNLSFQLLAIRDNRNVNLAPERLGRTRGRQAPNTATPAPRCTNPAVSVRFFVPSGCYENEWNIAYLRDGQHLQAHLNPTPQPPMRDYVFLAAQNMKYPGDWRVVAPYAGDRIRQDAASTLGRYELSSQTTLRTERIALQVIGKVISLRVADNLMSPNAQGLLQQTKQTLPLGPASVDIRVLCMEESETIEEMDCTKKSSFAYQIRLSSRTGRPESVRVELLVEPSLAPANEFTDLSDTQSAKLERVTNIRATCSGPHPNKQALPAGGQRPPFGACSLEWLQPDSAEQRAQANARIMLSKGDTSLVDTSGVLTDEAYKQGLADVIGLGPSTFGSLARRLSRMHDAGSEALRLTIDPDIQERAMSALKSRILCDPENRRQAMGKSPEAPCADEARGSLVVMDADAGLNGGEILAVAGWPRMSPGIGAWDLAALDAAKPADSPIAGNAWRAHENSAMAGSVFKVVTALAGIQHAIDAGDETLRSILMGSNANAVATTTKTNAVARNTVAIVERTFQISQAETGWKSGPCHPTLPASPGAGDVVVVYNAKGDVKRCVGNARESVASKLLPPGIASYRQACKHSDPNSFGLCEAMAMSSNLFFGGMALYLDTPKFAGSRERGAAMPELLLAQMTRRLFPDGLGIDAEPDAPRRDFNLLRGPPFNQRGFNVSRLNATPFRLPVEAARERDGDLRQLDLVLNGIGQAVTATPVNVATVYASVASGTIIRPTLMHLPDERTQRGDLLEGKPLLAVPADRQDDYDRLMRELRRGLNNVITVGTASKYFGWTVLNRELLEAIHLKTGTAILEEGEKLYSGWIAGWVDPPRNVKSGITRRMAIACHIAYTRRFGGESCAPIVGELIRSLHYQVRP